MTATPTTALVVKLVAKPETRGEVAEFLAGAVDLANAERLLAASPEILPADVLAAKVP